MGRRHLLGVRIVMKNMVYVVGMKLPAPGDEVSCDVLYSSPWCNILIRFRQYPFSVQTIISGNMAKYPNCTFVIEPLFPPLQSLHLHLTTLPLLQASTSFMSGERMQHEQSWHSMESLRRKDLPAKFCERHMGRRGTAMYFCEEGNVIMWLVKICMSGEEIVTALQRRIWRLRMFHAF